MTTRTLNLIDDHRRLYLQQSEVEPTLVCVLLFVAARPVAYAHADVQRCRFSVSSDGPLFWAGDANFLITEQERWQIEEFLAQCREYWRRAGVLFARAATEIERLRKRVAELEAREQRPDPLSQALNEGDGVYRP